MNKELCSQIKHFPVLMEVRPFDISFKQLGLIILELHKLRKMLITR